jgi:hypothetical protein
MASIRITQFAGLVPEITGRNIPAISAQIAHNCLLSNGTLRPQAKWVMIEEAQLGATPYRSLSYDRNTGRAVMYASFDAQTMEGAPFVGGAVIGAALTPPVVRHATGVGLTYEKTGIEGAGVTGTVSYSRAYLSAKPVNRVYAISRVRVKQDRIEEGPLAALIGDVDAVIYEGDTATLNISVSDVQDNATHIRIYRSITGLDTGQEVSNTLDTGWYLIEQVKIPAGGNIIYVDGGSITSDELDCYYAGEFHPADLLARYFGLLEGGWFVAVAGSGEIAISEKFLHHAWPTNQTYKIHETVNDMAVHMDNVYIGTNRAPYILSIQTGEKGIQCAAVPFQEPYRCLPNTMTPSPSGAIYASAMGLIALGKEGQRILTASIANAGDILYTRTVDDVEYAASISTTTFGYYHGGWYYGFCGGQPSDTFF